VFRLLLVLPADLFARVWTAPAIRSGSVANALQYPVSSTEFMSHFVKHFVLITWWVGAVIGAGLLWRRGNRKTDLAYGLIAGAVAGLVGSATLACLLPGLDWLPRLIGHKMALGKTTGLAWLWTPLWIVLAAASWTIWVPWPVSCWATPARRDPRSEPCGKRARSALPPLRTEAGGCLFR